MLGVLTLVGGLIYLNQVGLPEFMRRSLLETLRDSGLDLQLSTLRLHFYRGIVAEDVQAGQLGDAAGPRFTAREADLNLSWPALARLQLAVSGVDLRDGQVVFPITDTNQPGRTLVVEKIRMALRFRPDDEWLLEDFHAVFQGANFFLSGNITNASAMREWPWLRGEKVARGDLAQQRLRRLADTLGKIKFTTPPEVRVMLSGDARHLESFQLRLTVTAPDAGTPWGKLANGVLTARLLPAAPVERPHAVLQLRAASAQTRWADLARLNLNLQLQSSGADTNLINATLILDAASAHTPWADLVRPNLSLHLLSSDADTNLVTGSLTLDAATAVTQWASITNAQVTAQWLHALTNPIPLSGHAELRANAATSRWATAKGVQLTAALARPLQLSPTDASWGWWQGLEPFALGWTVRAARLDTDKLGADDVACGGNWSAPRLQITNLHLRFPDGQLDGRGQLDVATRAADFEVKSDFDAHRVAPLLTAQAQRWLNRYAWATPPHVAGTGAVTLPAWTNRAPNWEEEVLPTLRLAGQVAVTNGAYLGVPVDWATLHLSLTNQVWRLPDLVAARPEGRLELVHIADDKTHEFYFGIHSTFDPRAARPLFGTNQAGDFDLLTFTQPPEIEGEVWGHWRKSDLVGFRGRVALTNFAYRGETASRFESSLRYTNRFLELLQPRLERGPQAANAGGVAVDLDRQRLFITNGFSTVEPMVIARAIGPKTAQAIEPYRFLEPPVAYVNGSVPLKGEQDTDLRFDVAGGPFEWMDFKIPQIAARVHWLGETLTLTKVQLTAYDGTAAGFANFDFRAKRGTDFQFNLGVTNADLRLLMADVSPHTNNLEGRLSGELVVTQANSEDKFSWDGRGQLQLRDGLIWAIPVFGVLSKPLDTLAPGLGSTRITRGEGDFSLADGVMFSDALELRAPTSRLLCHGTVDFDGKVNFRVTAVPMRVPLGFDRLLGLALWPVTKLFEYRVTGSLNHPKPEPVYVPKLLLHPFRTFEEMFSGEGGKTTPPPVIKDAPKNDPP